MIAGLGSDLIFDFFILTGFRSNQSRRDSRRGLYGFQIEASREFGVTRSPLVEFLISSSLGPISLFETRITRALEAVGSVDWIQSFEKKMTIRTSLL